METIAPTYGSMPEEVAALLDGRADAAPVPRRPCACGRAYVLNPTPGQPCLDCIEEIYADAARCERCGDRGWIWHPDAVCFANEWEARTCCPDCSPDYGPAYD